MSTNTVTESVVAVMTPVRVLINVEGEAKSPGRAEREHGIEPTVIFVRGDGWSLGAPAHLEKQARRTWIGQWVERWVKRTDGSWRRTWPLEDETAYTNQTMQLLVSPGRQTVSDAIAQLNLARVGSLVTHDSLLLTTQHLPYLRELRNQIFKWSDQVEAEIARVEAES